MLNKQKIVNDHASEEVISTKQLTKRFGDCVVLKGIDLSVRKGEIVTLIGSSGSGKSTLLRCLNLLEIPDSGQLCVDGKVVEFSERGHNIEQVKVRQIRRSLGMVFQNFNLWTHMTALENVMCAPMHVHKLSKDESFEIAREQLKRVGLVDRMHHYPKQLSGGQQQRVAIARALAVSPSALLLDEPTSALDPELVGEVSRVLSELADCGTTMVMVTHEMKFAANVSSKIIFLHNGNVEDSGSPQQLFHSPTSERCRDFLSVLN